MISLRVGESSWRKASTPIDNNDIVVIHPRKLTGGTWKWGTLEKEMNRTLKHGTYKSPIW